MTPAGAIATINRIIGANGQEIILRRVTGTTNQVAFDATVRAWVKAYQPHELSVEIIQGDSMVTLSPTDIAAVQWPGAQPAGSIGDPQVPRKGDKVVIQGRERTVMSAAPWYINGQLVRIDLQSRGQQ